MVKSFSSFYKDNEVVLPRQLHLKRSILKYYKNRSMLPKTEVFLSRSVALAEL